MEISSSSPVPLLVDLLPLSLGPEHKLVLNGLGTRLACAMILLFTMRIVSIQGSHKGQRDKKYVRLDIHSTTGCTFYYGDDSSQSQ